MDDCISRISVSEALEHPYLQDCRYPEGEPVADHVVGVDAEEEAATSLDDWRGVLRFKYESKYVVIMELFVLQGLYGEKSRSSDPLVDVVALWGMLVTTIYVKSKEKPHVQ